MSFKKILLFSLLLLGTLGTVQAQVILDAGISVTSLNEISPADPSGTYENSNGWHLGLSFDIGGRRFSLRPGVRYMNGQGLYEGLTDGNTTYTDGFDLSYLEVPIDLKFAISEKNVSPYIVAGPVLRIPVNSSDEEFKEAIQNLSYAGEVGFGIQIKVGNIGIYPELDYVFGVTEFLNESFSIGNVNFTANQDATINNFILKLGVSL